MFSHSINLPLECAQDHHIPLLPNNQPVSVRPYYYSFHQKSKIEVGDFVLIIGLSMIVAMYSEIRHKTCY